MLWTALLCLVGGPVPAPLAGEPHHSTASVAPLDPLETEALDAVPNPARSLLNEALQAALQMEARGPESKLDRYYVIAAIAVTQARAGFVSDARKTAAQFASDNDQVWAAVVRAMAAEGNIAGAKDVMREKSGLCPDPRIPRCGNATCAMDYAPLAVFEERVRRGDYVAALADFSHVPRRDYLLYAAGKLFAQTGNLQAAREIWKELREGTSAGRFNGSLVAGEIAKAQVAAGDFAGARQTAAGEDYVEVFLRYRIHVEEWILEEALRRGDFANAHQAADRFESERDQFVRRHEVKIPPLADDILNTRRVERLLKIADAETRAGMTVEASATIHKALSEFRVSSKKLMDENRDGDLWNSVRESLSARWGQIVAAEIRAGIEPAAMPEALSFIRTSRQPDGLSPIAMAQMRAGNSAGVKAVERMARRPMWSVYFNAAVDQARSGDVERAIQTLATHLEPPELRWNLAWLATEVSKSGHHREASVIADRLGDMEARIAGALYDNEMLDGEPHERDEMLREEDRTDYHSRVVRKVARAWGVNGKSEDALTWARRQPTSRTVAEALLGLVEGMSGLKGEPLSNT